MMSELTTSSSKSAFSIEENLKNDLNIRFGSVLFEGTNSSAYFRRNKESKILMLPVLTRSSNDPDVQMKISDFMERSEISNKLRQIIRSPDFSIKNNPANIIRRNIMHRDCIVIFISKVFLSARREYACFIADFLIERPLPVDLNPIFFNHYRFKSYGIHKKLRIAQITNKLCELGHISVDIKNHLIEWFKVDTLDMNNSNWSRLYIQPNEHRSFLEENNIPVREIEIGCPLFDFLEPYFVHLEGQDSSGLKIVKEMSARFFNSYHI